MARGIELRWLEIHKSCQSMAACIVGWVVLLAILLVAFFWTQVPGN